MKKFNEWAGNITENLNKNFTSNANINSDSASTARKFETIISKLDAEHEKETLSGNVNKSDLNRRARLIRSIDLLHYDNLSQFLKDWNFIKTHAEDDISSSINKKNFEDDLNVIRKN